MSIFHKFLADENAAVTVDWVVLTAAIVGITIAVLTLISTGINNASNAINDTVDTSGGGWDTVISK